MEAAIVGDLTTLLDGRGGGLVRRNGDIKRAVARRRGVQEGVLVDPFDGVPDFGAHLGRREDKVQDGHLNRLGRGSLRTQQSRGRKQECHPQAAPHRQLYLSSAATCSACCSWP